MPIYTFVTRKCPRCGHVFDDSVLDYISLGPPFWTCPKCGLEVRVDHMNEWALVAPEARLKYYFSAMGGLLSILCAVIGIFTVIAGAAKSDGFEMVVFGLLLVAGSLIWATIGLNRLSKAIAESDRRMADPKYRQRLMGRGGVAQPAKIVSENRAPVSPNPVAGLRPESLSVRADCVHSDRNGRRLKVKTFNKRAMSAIEASEGPLFEAITGAFAKLNEDSSEEPDELETFAGWTVRNFANPPVVGFIYAFYRANIPPKVMVNSRMARILERPNPLLAALKARFRRFHRTFHGKRGWNSFAERYHQRTGERMKIERLAIGWIQGSVVDEQFLKACATVDTSISEQLVGDFTSG
jgi:hypothetical protein